MVHLYVISTHKQLPTETLKEWLFTYGHDVSFLFPDMREQTMLTERPTTTENVPYSKQITSNNRLSSTTMSASEVILLNVTTTEALTSLGQHQTNFPTPQHDTAETAQLHSTATTAASPSVAEQRTSTSAAEQTVDQYKTNFSVKFTTFRPCKIYGQLHNDGTKDI